MCGWNRYPATWHGESIRKCKHTPLYHNTTLLWYFKLRVSHFCNWIQTNVLFFLWLIRLIWYADMLILRHFDKSRHTILFGTYYMLSTMSNKTYPHNYPQLQHLRNTDKYYKIYTYPQYLHTNNTIIHIQNNLVIHNKIKVIHNLFDY